MPICLESSSAESKRDGYRHVLQRIAHTLGIPVERLIESAGSDAVPDEMVELIRLWFMILDPEQKQRLFEQIRTIMGK